MYHKAAYDKKSAGVLSRLARQAAAFYSEVGASFSAPALQQHFERSWASHAALKASLHDVEALQQAGRAANAESKVGPEIAYLSEAFARLQATKKLAKAVSAEMADGLKPLEEGLVAALSKAQRDNAAVYLERVPSFADLPPIQVFFV